jgi:hypothetical protein
MARTSLARRPARTLTAGVALFAGALAIGLGLSIVSTASDELSGRFDASETVPVRVFAGEMPAAELIEVLGQSPLNDVVVESVAQSAIVSLDSTGAVVTGRVAAVLAASAEMPDSIRYEGHKLISGRWPGPGEVALGIEASELEGPVRIGLEADAPALDVVGRFRPGGLMSGLLVAIVAPADALLLGAERTQDAVGWVSKADHDAAVEAVGQVVPQAMVFSRLDIEQLVNGLFVRAFWFVAGMSALAGLAGVVLISNAVGMALVERRREIGMLQAVGYGRRHLLSLFALEYGLIGAVSGAAGAAAAALVLLGLSRLADGPQFALTWGQALLLVALTTALAAGCALATAAPTVRGRPLRLLRAAE